MSSPSVCYCQHGGRLLLLLMHLIWGSTCDILHRDQKPGDVCQDVHLHYDRSLVHTLLKINYYEPTIRCFIHLPRKTLLRECSIVCLQGFGALTLTHSILLLVCLCTVVDQRRRKCECLDVRLLIDLTDSLAFLGMEEAAISLSGIMERYIISPHCQTNYLFDIFARKWTLFICKIITMIIM